MRSHFHRTGGLITPTPERLSLGLALLERALGRGGIIAYHGVRETSLLPSTHVTPLALQSHLEFLAREYEVIALEEYVRRRSGGKSLRGCVAVTFDDAYTGVLRYALPLLQRLRLPATIFVATGFCRQQRFWWDRFEWVLGGVSAAARADLLRSVGLGATAEHHEVRDRIITHYHGGIPRSLDGALRRAERRLGQVPERAMTLEELLELGNCELIDFGCHSAHHYALPWLPMPKAVKEIRRDYEWLRQRLARVRPYLAYPYGLYTMATVEAARRAGMQAAFSIEQRAATSHFPLYYCPRIGMADVNTLKGLRLRLTWMAIPLVAARNRGWHPRLRPDAVPTVGNAQ